MLKQLHRLAKTGHCRVEDLLGPEHARTEAHTVNKPGLYILNPVSVSAFHEGREVDLTFVSA